ncbi:MAG: hypothetical protein DRJ10_00540 [Bacteroidetes bacterium]|nr:MAG: hypothetical protein DRJ10_00540 [Bacteroidota bacterium]
MVRAGLILLLGIFLFSCSDEAKNNYIDEDKLGFIDADLNSDETNLKEKAKYDDRQPGKTEEINRSFENAPPLIPHSTKGFFPIKIDNNICLSCHMPDKVEETGAREISKTHFMNWRPKPEEIDGIFRITENDSVATEQYDKLNNSYFNCSQCHVPQTNVTVNIENLFTAKFREKFGLEQSNLNEKVNEGIK